MRRIAIVGSTGSGKTTLANALGQRLGLPVVELDALHWGAGWEACPPEEFRSRAAHALAPQAWVCDGNYSELRDLVWGRADTLVWLDLPMALLLVRLLGRTLRRIVGLEQSALTIDIEDLIRRIDLIDIDRQRIAGKEQALARPCFHRE